VKSENAATLGRGGRLIGRSPNPDERILSIRDRQRKFDAIGKRRSAMAGLFRAYTSLMVLVVICERRVGAQAIRIGRQTSIIADVRHHPCGSKMKAA
jgi:hypothetical protein